MCKVTYMMPLCLISLHNFNFNTFNSMKSIVLNETGLSIQDCELPFVGVDQSKVEISCASLNHRDLWITKGQYAGIKYPIILGSDASGYLNDQKVLINPSTNWFNDPIGQPKDYEIIGLPRDGTLRQEGIFNNNLIHSIPEHLTMEEASALPLAGLTAYRVLISRCKVKSGDKVLVTGIGGGVALFAAQFAIALGAEVWVTSGDDSKIQKSLELGVKGGINYKIENWHKQLNLQAGGFDVIIDGAGGQGFSHLLSLANAGANIGIYGGTTGKIEGLSPQILFWKQLNIHGSTMGNHTEFSQMLKLVSDFKIRPVIDSIYHLNDFQKAFDRMDSGKQFGKIIISLK